jgi:predicted transposase/invertase (TIGR01784 family)
MTISHECAACRNQEALEEGELKAKLESIPRFLAFGLSVEQIAEGLGLSVEEVRQAAQQFPQSKD